MAQNTTPAESDSAPKSRRRRGGNRRSEASRQTDQGQKNQTKQTSAKTNPHRGPAQDASKNSDNRRKQRQKQTPSGPDQKQTAPRRKQVSQNANQKSTAQPAVRQGRQPAAQKNKSAGQAIKQQPKANPKAKSKVQKKNQQPKTGRQSQVANQPDKLKIIPLGGMREIGKNLTVYEYGQDMIIVDCGIAFPDEDMPGIDVVIPDFSYVLQNKDKLRGIFLTHGHEDHIGALPWLCKDVKVPIYGNRLTIELTRQKLADRGTGVKGVDLQSVKSGDKFDAGCFQVEFIHANHSIADANSLAIRTPAGIIFHTGDFKIDYTPIYGDPIDLARIAQIGSEGVTLMFCESTNVEVRGYSPSESTVGETFAELFAKATGRIFVATFSSNVFRVQQIITAAEMYGRKVALIGRSMLNVFEAANSLGLLSIQPDTLVDINHIDRYPPEKILIITTGSQGEPLSALTRMAFSEHRKVEIQQGDTVILSSSPIPGNEKPIYRVINELFRRGAHVIYKSLEDIHVSGHAYREEIKLMHRLVKPKFFIPAHGEYRHLYQHAELAHELGLPWEQIFILNNGDIFETDGRTADISGFTNAAGVMIDGSGMGDVDNLVLRDRMLLADDGVVTVFLAVDGATNRIVGEPDIQARGFIYQSETNRIIQDCRKKINTLAQRADQTNKPLAAMIESGLLRDQLRDLLFQKTRRRPVILVSVIEI